MCSFCCHIALKLPIKLLNSISYKGLHIFSLYGNVNSQTSFDNKHIFIVVAYFLGTPVVPQSMIMLTLDMQGTYY